MGLRTLLLLWITCIGVLFPACSNDGEQQDHFLVDNTSDSDSGEGDGGREVSEADIVFVEDDAAYCPMGAYGLQAIALP